MDTSIKMKPGHKEMVFWGDIYVLRISKMVKSKDPLVHQVIKIILGEEFSALVDRPNHNSNIVAMFITPTCTWIGTFWYLGIFVSLFLMLHFFVNWMMS